MRHRLHALCPYFAMFPEAFVKRNLLSWSEPGDLILDPFCGRGTTILEGLLNHRVALGCDTNPVAFCISKAKSNMPDLAKVFERLRVLEDSYLENQESDGVEEDEFFRLCYHPSTLKQLLYLRRQLHWKKSQTDCFIAALCLGALHGEGHRSENCFSNRMPRTISTKPNYSVRWWKTHGYSAPLRDVFAILRSMTFFRFETGVPDLLGKVRMGDARRVSDYFPDAHQKVRLVITSPPYLDITDYREDQWLRIWFLGGESYPVSKGKNSDDRHRRVPAYWQFLSEVWSGMAPLLDGSANVVIRIGGTRLSRSEIAIGLENGLANAFSARIKLAEVSTSEIRQGQRQSFTPASRLAVAVEHDFRFSLS